MQWGNRADPRRCIAKCHIYRPLSHFATKIWETYSVVHEDEGNNCISHWDHWLKVNWHVKILDYISLPVSPTTSPQCKFPYRCISVAYHCYITAERHKSNSWCRLDDGSTISCLWWCLDFSVWWGIGECHSVSCSRECVVYPPQEPDHLAGYAQVSWRNPRCWSLGYAQRGSLPSVRCHTTSSCPSSWSHTGYNCTLCEWKTGSRNCFVR